MSYVQSSTNVPDRLRLRPEDVPDDPEIRPSWIKYQLEVRGWSLSEIARRIGVSQQAVSYALRRPSKAIEGTIATLLGVPESLLFSERYRDDGSRRRGVHMVSTHRRRMVQDRREDGLMAEKRLS
ncbi:Ner family transcriptional regulator [Azospirillaceae bacterium]